MSRKSIIVLGAGRGQIPIIEILHKHNCYVIAISPKGDYPGLKLADEVIYLDVRAKDEILSIAHNKKISGILTDQLDEGVLTAAYVSDALGLKGIGYDTAIKFTDKFIMRQEAEKLNFNVPQNVRVSERDDLKEKIKNLKFPLMIKPVDSSASRGVFKVYTEYELHEKIKLSFKWSKNGLVIIEEFIEGKEFVIDAYTHNRKTTNLVVGEREYFNIKDTFIPKSTIFIDANSANDNLKQRLKEINVRLVEGFGLNFGITHAEYIYNEKEDKIYLVEIAARGGGVFISSDLIPMTCGVNALELLVKDVLDLNLGSDLTVEHGASAYYCYMLPHGEIISLKGKEEVIKTKNLIKAFFDNVEVGMEIGSITDKSSRKGPFLVKGTTTEECQKTFEAIKKLLEIKVKTAEGIKLIIWE